MKFGSTIRPELGRMDFSGIERGGRAAAEAIMRGSEQLGAGIRSAGESIGQAMEKTKEREFQVAEQQKAMKSQIAGTQTIIKGLLTLDELPEPQKVMLQDFSTQLGNEEIPVSNRFNMAKQLTGVGSAVFENYMESQKPQQPKYKFIDRVTLEGGREGIIRTDESGNVDIVPLESVMPEKDKPAQTFEQAKRKVKLSDGTEVPVVFDRASGKFKMTNKQGNVVDVPPDAEFIGEDQITQSKVNVQVLEALGNLGKTADQLTDEEITNYTDNPIIRGALIKAREEALRSQEQNMISNWLMNSNNGNNNPDPLNINQ